MIVEVSISPHLLPVAHGHSGSAANFVYASVVAADDSEGAEAGGSDGDPKTCMLELPCTQVEMLVVYSGMAVGVDIETVAVHIIYVQNVCEEYPPS